MSLFIYIFACAFQATYRPASYIHLGMNPIKFALFAVTFCCRQVAAQEETTIINYEYVTTGNISDGFASIEIHNVDDLLKAFGDKDLYFRADNEDYINGNVTKDQAHQRPIDIAVTWLYGTITVVGLIANAIVFFVIFAGNEIGKTVTTIYVLQLTIADTIFLFTLPIFSLQKINDSWQFGVAVCAFCQTIKFLNYYAGIFFLTAMSVDRYVAVAYSTRLTQLRSKSRTYWICAGVWVAAIVMSVPLMLYARLNDDDGDDEMRCKVMFPGYKKMSKEDKYIYLTYGSGDNYLGYEEEYFDDRDDRELDKFTCNFKDEPHSYRAWLIINFLIGFAIPFMVIVAMYALILTHLKTAEEKIGHTATSRAAHTRKRVTKMVAALVVCFTICWLPHHILMLAKIQGFESSVLACYATEEIFVALAFANSALNPILYTFMGNNFSDRFRKSVRNTQMAVKRRTSSRNSYHRRSANNHSHPSNQNKASAGLIVHYRKTSSNGSSKENSQNGKSKKCSMSLLGSKKDKSRSNSDNHSGDGSQKAETFYPTTTATLLEHTMETKI